jgi:hypothetical protein
MSSAETPNDPHECAHQQRRQHDSNKHRAENVQQTMRAGGLVADFACVNGRRAP